MAGEIPFVGICPGPDEENPVTKNPGYPQLTIVDSTVVFNGCNHLVNSDQCKALEEQNSQLDEDKPHDSLPLDELPPCRAVTVLYSQGFRKVLGEKREEDDSPIRTIRTRRGVLSHNRSEHRILVSPLLQRGHAPIEITRAESKFIDALMEHQGEVLSPAELHRIIFGEELVGGSKSIAAIKSRVCKKLGEKPKDGKVIIDTVRGNIKQDKGGYTIGNPSPRPRR